MGSDYMQPEMKTFQPESRGFEKDIMKWIESLQQAPAQQREIPGTPATEGALGDVQAHVGQYGRPMSEFFGGMMQTGGRGGMEAPLESMQELGDINKQRIWSDVMSRGASGSSSAVRAGLGGMREADLRGGIAMNQMQQDVINRANANRFGGATGLGSMPSFYGTPSTLEQAMFSMQEPARQQNFAAGQDRESAISSLLANMMGYNYYQPERMMMPSQFQQNISPWLNPLMGLGGDVASAAIMA